MKYKNLIFDFDGTLCDTSKGIIKCIFYALDSLGINVDKDEVDTNSFIGPPLLYTFEQYFIQDTKTAKMLVDKYREKYKDIVLLESKLYPGIKELIKSLKADGFSLGIASSKPTKYITELLEKFEVFNYFDAVCGVSFKDDCEEKKNIIKRCVNELHGDIDNSIVFGDTHYDINAAKSVDIDSCGVTWGFEETDELLNAGAKYIAKKTDDIESIALGLYEKETKENLIYNGRILNLYKNEIELCDGSHTIREVVEHHGGVAVVALTDNAEVLMVRQYRAGSSSVLIELPAGKLELNEDPLEAAKRELKEECGAEPKKIFKIAEIYPTPAYDTEIIRIYCATGLKIGNAHLDKGEFLEKFSIPLQMAIDMCYKNEIKDAKTIIGIFKVKELIDKNAISFDEG